MDEFSITTGDDARLTVSASNVMFSAWKNFDIDFDKVRSMEDVVNLLRGMRIIISADEANPPEWFTELRPYLKARES